MRTLLRLSCCAVALVALSWLPALAQDDAEAEQPKLPATFDEYKERHAELATKPEGALKAYFDALYVFMNPETREEGYKMVAYIVIDFKTGDRPWTERANSKLFADRLQDPAFQHIFRSYAKGTSPENQYEMDPNNYELEITRTVPDHPLGYQLFIRSTGADNPRPLHFRRSKTSNLWYVSSMTGIHSEVRKSVDPEVEEFE